jgi:hypothetical protein
MEVWRCLLRRVLLRELVRTLNGYCNGLITRRINSFASALSKCQKLVRLDLSHTRESFTVLDLLRAVGTLSSLKIFHFPHGSQASSESGENEAPRDEAPYKWPNSLEQIFIPHLLDVGYMVAVRSAPASLTSLVIGEVNHYPITY